MPQPYSRVRARINKHIEAILVAEDWETTKRHERAAERMCARVRSTWNDPSLHMNGLNIFEHYGLEDRLNKAVSAAWERLITTSTRVETDLDHTSESHDYAYADHERPVERPNEWY